MFMKDYIVQEKFKVENALATKTEESKDGKRWTFTLRKGAKWSNGDPVTAKDFVYSWQRTVDPKTGSQYTSLFSGIENADEITKLRKERNLQVLQESRLLIIINQK